MNKETALPLIIFKNDKFCGTALMSPKGYNKSLEQKVLWVNHPGNNRILPMEGDIPFMALEIEGDHYKAVIHESTELPHSSLHLEHIDLEDHGEVAASADAQTPSVLSRLEETIAQRHKDMPEGSYTTHLFNKGLDKIKKKTGEEAVELLLAQKKEDLVFESADLIYHLMVLWESTGISLQDILAELQRREG